MTYKYFRAIAGLACGTGLVIAIPFAVTNHTSSKSEYAFKLWCDEQDENDPSPVRLNGVFNSSAYRVLKYHTEGVKEGEEINFALAEDTPDVIKQNIHIQPTTGMVWWNKINLNVMALDFNVYAYYKDNPNLISNPVNFEASFAWTKARLMQFNYSGSYSLQSCYTYAGSTDTTFTATVLPESAKQNITYEIISDDQAVIDNVWYDYQTHKICWNDQLPVGDYTFNVSAASEDEYVAILSPDFTLGIHYEAYVYYDGTPDPEVTFHVGEEINVTGFSAKLVPAKGIPNSFTYTLNSGYTTGGSINPATGDVTFTPRTKAGSFMFWVGAYNNYDKTIIAKEYGILVHIVE